MGMELADFLLARIAEDEAGVRDGMPERLADWNPPEPWRYDSEYQDVHMNCGRALAECGALREVVGLHSEGQYGHVDKHLCHDSMTTDVECEVLRELAVIWSTHADYQPAWKPYR